MSYAPCRYGIHVCGTSADELEPVTVKNFPRVSKAMFDSLKSDYAISDQDPDLVVDFMCDGDILDDFGIRRQMLEVIEAVIAVEAA